MRKIFLLPLNFKGKTEFLLEKIKEENLLNNFVYITSNFCKVQDFKIKFYQYFKNPFIPPVFTLKSLTIKILEEKSNKRVISEIEKYLILLEILKKEKIGTTPYSDEGFAKIVLNFIKELKISSITDISKIKK